MITGVNNRSILVDISFKRNLMPKQLVLFSHGFKGFKDWGPFNHMSEYFAKNNIIFVKFNFSHNGTTVNNPSKFDDLDAFGNNNFCKELDDLSLVIDWLLKFKEIQNDFDISNIALFGHSRGGAISVLKTMEDNRIRKVVSWASPSNLLKRLPSGEKLQNWKKTNIAYVYNGRTKQHMPMYYQFYQNTISNRKRLNIKNAVSSIKIPYLIIHGTNDNTVLVDESYHLKSWNQESVLYTIADADHVMGSFHPYNRTEFPKFFKEAMDVTISFLKQ